MEIPFEKLSEEALNNLITDFVCRQDDFDTATLEKKIQQIKKQLQSGEVVLSYDEDTQTCNLQTRTDFEKPKHVNPEQSTQYYF